MKRMEPIKTLPRFLDIPAANEIYPGTNGSTHGERKEINPAIIAIGNAVSNIPSII
jgi:hypothetical protein